MWRKNKRENISQLLEKILQRLEDLENTTKECSKNLEDRLKEIIFEIAKKIDEFEVLTKERKKTFFLIDGANTLNITRPWGLKIDWRNFINEIQRVYGIESSIMWSFGFSHSLLRQISTAGIEIRIFAYEASFGRDITDQKLLEFVQSLPIGSFIIVLTNDRVLKSEVATICLRRGIKFEFLTIDLNEQKIIDSNGKIAFPLSSLPPLSKEKTQWNEVAERIQQGNLDPQKSEKDRIIIEALRALYYLLASSLEKRENGIQAARSILQLISDIASYLHACGLKNFTRADISVIVDVALGLGLIRKVKVGKKVLCIRNKEWPKSLTKFFKS